MLNVHELERQWFRYKIRYYMPLAVAGVTVMAGAAAAWFFWPENTPEQTVDTTKPAVVQEVQRSVPDPSLPANTMKQSNVASGQVATLQNSMPAATSSNTVTPVPTEAPVERSVMQPSLGFIQSLEEETQPYYENDARTPDNAPQAVVQSERVPQPLSQVTNTKPEAVETVSEPVKTVNATPSQTSKVSITQKEATDLNDVIKRFATNKNPALSLFIASRYYELGEYKHAYDYALQTNELDSGIEASWLIFAKSLVKLNQREQALKVLGSYIQHSGSIRAKDLSDDIKSGKFQ